MDRKSSARAPVFASLVAVVLLTLPGAAHAGGTELVPFVTSIIEANVFSGESLSLVIDENGNPHIAYQDAVNQKLRYGKRVNGAWLLEDVDVSPGAGAYCAITLDSQGRPHVSYQVSTGSKLRYAYRDAGSWVLETVDSLNTVGLWTSIVLDSDDLPRISHHDLTNGDLRYSEKVGGNWSTIALFPSGSDINGLYSSIDLTPADDPRISFLNIDGFAQDRMRVAYRDGGGTWTNELVDGPPDEVGRFSSMDLDGSGLAHVSYYDMSNSGLLYGFEEGLTFAVEVVDAPAGVDVGRNTDIVVDGSGVAHISYQAGDALKYARRISTDTWENQAVDTSPFSADRTSIAVDSQGNPMILYSEGAGGQLRLADASVRLANSMGGETWPVGAARTVEWRGAGVVDVLLSVDGGQTYESLATGVADNEVPIQVPNRPTRFAKIRIQRNSPFSTSDSDSFFTIEANINLLNLTVRPAPVGTEGNLISWSTEPGPADLAGYRLERAVGSGPWQTLVDQTTETSFLDPASVAGARYRLFAVNRLGTELLLGEASVAPSAPLAAWPMPYRSGPLQISFATSGGLGGGAARAEVALYDGAGRLVRRIASGEFGAGVQQARWDGRDASGRAVPPGVYFLRASHGLGASEQIKLVIIR